MLQKNQRGLKWEYHPSSASPAIPGDVMLKATGAGFAARNRYAAIPTNDKAPEVYRYSAVSLLCGSVFVFFCMSSVAIHHKSLKDAQIMAGVSLVASAFFSIWLIFCWFAGSVSIRCATIERRFEPRTYQLAMLGFLIIDLAFLASLILNLYGSHR